MVMSAQRWSAIAESEFDWEREALAFLRDYLPDVDPWHVWSNFEFIDDQGRVIEVDALVLSPRGLFLVEIKSRPGRVEGDAHSWTWVQDGRTSTYDNPYLLANRKATRMKSLLQRQDAFRRARLPVPFVNAVIQQCSSGIESGRTTILLSRVSAKARMMGKVVQLAGFTAGHLKPGLPDQHRCRRAQEFAHH